MKVPGNSFIQQSIGQLVPHKKPDAEKKLETMYAESQRQLEQSQRMAKEEENYQIRMEAERIAKKIARGEHVTDEERQKLSNQDPEWLRKAEQANLERKSVRAKLAKATTKAEVSAIVLDSKASAGKVMEQGDEQLGELLLEAIDQAEREHHGLKRPLQDETLAMKRDREMSVFDIRL